MAAFKLKNGAQIAAIGFGTWKVPKASADSVKVALEVGYRHIDGAAIYGNEKEIGDVYSSFFKTGKLKRESIFITSKLWNTAHHPDDVGPACQKTLDDLQLDYLDLYLIHWPIAFKRGRSSVPMDDQKRILLESIPLGDTWRAMEDLVHKGKVRNIGVSNFSIEQLQEVMKSAKIMPAVNQVEVHPYLPQHELISFCKQHEIHVSAYSPLGTAGTPKLLEDPTLVQIAKEINRTTAQISLRWLVDRGVSVLPKSVTPQRIASNLDLNFTLTPEQTKAINNIKTRVRFGDPSELWKTPQPLFKATL